MTSIEASNTVVVMTIEWIFANIQAITIAARVSQCLGPGIRSRHFQIALALGYV
jgi:hypothetical protein